MLMHRRLLLSLCLLLVSFSAQAADLIQGVAERLAQPALLRGEFEQNKTVAGFKKPLVAKERGVLWETVQPFPSLLKLTRDEIVASENGAVAFRLNASKEPTVRVINGLMFSLLNGDVKALADIFTIQGELSGKSWTLALTPKQAAMSKVMSKIDLSGERYVREITISEANGDLTRIRFSAQSEPATLNATDVKRFE
jgi:outer membrane lipoprotein-sorting protein